jgi:four helix bundle protein
MEASMPSFEDLDVWKRAVEFSSALYKGLTGVRDYSFRDQLTSSGLSVPSNIAEGMERETITEKVRFLTIARSSCGEARTQIYVGINAGYINPDIGKQWIRESRELSAMLVGLSRSFRL